MLKRAVEVKVEVFTDRIEAISAGRRVTRSPTVPYLGRRALIGRVQPAAACLRELLKDLGAKGPLRRRPTVTLQPMARHEGGLDGPEKRALFEAGAQAGAGRMFMYEPERIKRATFKRVKGRMVPGEVQT